jgi:peptidoglycan/LPS O-acetylase OafA/YrhL
MAQHRITSLDGLRGAAALVVVVSHTLLSATFFAAPLLHRDGPMSRMQWVDTNTPVHLLWNGSAAVVVFFVLSGFVLTLPFTRAPAVSWLSYYPKRLIRLYLPVWAALVFALLMVAVFPRHHEKGLTWWVNAQAVSTTVGGVRKDTLLVLGTDLLNGPLWSLRWEVIFSVLLPVYIAAAGVSRRSWFQKVFILLGISAVGAVTNHDSLLYLPVFGLGVLMAVEREAVHRAAARLRTPAWWGILILALLLLNAGWTPLGTRIRGDGFAADAGAMLLVFAFLTWPAARRFGDSRICAWLGTRSFSLYLVHAPVVLSAAMVVGSHNAPLLLAICLPVSLATSEIFFRLIERPAHRLAIAAGAPARPAIRSAAAL